MDKITKRGNLNRYCSFTVNLALSLLICSCALPKSSILLFKETKPSNIKVSDLPPEWTGRLIRSGENRIGLSEGKIYHRHSITHKHEGKVSTTQDTIQPLGLRKVTTDVGHVHRIESVGTQKEVSSKSHSMPRSYGLRGVKLQRSIWYRVPKGLVIGYLGENLPRGWVWCDGNNETPDLRSRYIKLNGELGPQGSSSHSHSAQHAHTWATAENVDKQAYFGDFESGSVTASKRIHRHSPGAAIASNSQVSKASNRPPAFGVRFIMSTHQSAKVPTGALVPYEGEKAPRGWVSCVTIFGESSLNNLLYGDWRASKEPFFSGKLTHIHRLTSKHEFLMDSANGAAGNDRPGIGPKIPRSDHRHRVTVEDQVTTSSETSWPPHVRLMLILKK